MMTRKFDGLLAERPDVAIHFAGTLNVRRVSGDERR